MKPVKFIACLILFCALCMTCYGQTEKVSIADYGSGIFKLIYMANEPGTVKVSILNSKDETIFTESLYKVSSFSRPYNFNDQGAGNYKMVVEDKDGKTEKPISYSIKKVESLIDVSKIANASNKYLLSIENKESDQIQVKILDQAKNVIHEESITVNGKFAVVYNLNKLKSVPTFEVSGSSGARKNFNF
jgi:hypothetical protein